MKEKWIIVIVLLIFLLDKKADGQGMNMMGPCGQMGQMMVCKCLRECPEGFMMSSMCMDSGDIQRMCCPIAHQLMCHKQKMAAQERERAQKQAQTQKTMKLFDLFAQLIQLSQMQPTSSLGTQVPPATVAYPIENSSQTQGVKANGIGIMNSIETSKKSGATI